MTDTDPTDSPHGWARLLIEPRRPLAIRTRPSAPWLVVATVSIGAFLGQLDASIVTLALPTLEQHFHTSLAAVEWVALSYLLTLVATVTAVGRVADMIGRKLLYTYGFAVFTLASIGCGLAPQSRRVDRISRRASCRCRDAASQLGRPDRDRDTHIKSGTCDRYPRRRPSRRSRARPKRRRFAD